MSIKLIFWAAFDITSKAIYLLFFMAAFPPSTPAIFCLRFFQPQKNELRSSRAALRKVELFNKTYTFVIP